MKILRAFGSITLNYYLYMLLHTNDYLILKLLNTSVSAYEVKIHLLQIHQVYVRLILCVFYFDQKCNNVNEFSYNFKTIHSNQFLSSAFFYLKDNFKFAFYKLTNF